jgi:hypothetical protein
VNLHPNLSDGSIFSKDVVHFFGGDFVRKISYVQDPVYLRGKSDLQLVYNKKCIRDSKQSISINAGKNSMWFNSTGSTPPNSSKATNWFCEIRGTKFYIIEQIRPTFVRFCIAAIAMVADLY